MIDTKITALRIAEELYSKIEFDENGGTLTVGEVREVFLRRAAHDLTNDNFQYFYDSGEYLSALSCEDGRVFSLAHVCYHIIKD